jgi:hypothetical protein
MKLKMRSIASAIALVAIGAGLLSCGKTSYVMQYSPIDSPINLGGGGSLYGWVTFWNFNKWAQHAGTIYKAHSTNNDYLLLDGFNVDPITVQQTGGWLIQVTTKDSNSNKGIPSIAFCSNLSPNGTQYHQCSGDGFMGDRTVYAEITSATAKWDYVSHFPKNEIYFEDDQPGCSGTESKCDEIYSVTITTVNSMSSLKSSTLDPIIPGRYSYGPYTCSVNSKCKIQSGD